jgi:magnesium transporter
MAENPTSGSDQNKAHRHILLGGSDKNEPVWLDITAPGDEDIAFLAETYQLHPLTLQDCLQPDHLPKFEQLDTNNAFIIVRLYDQQCKNQPDSIQDVSNKIAIFIGQNYIITLHRAEYAFLEDVAVQLHEWSQKSKKSWTTAQALGRLLRECGASYIIPAQKIEDEIEYYESRIFLRAKTKDLLRSLYLLKRKISLFRRIILLSREPVTQSRSLYGGRHSQLFQDVADRQLELEILFDQLSENMSQLMNLYISLASQRTNEVMRVLTIFSVFFLPLTFIVGIYGMNFEFMPELGWQYGYPGVWVLMALVTIVVFFWFKARRWL